MSGKGFGKLALIGVEVENEEIEPWRDWMRQQGLEVFFEPIKPDLVRLRGTLMAAMGDPRFDVIAVVGGQRSISWHQLHTQLMSFSQLHLDLFPQQALHCLMQTDPSGGGHLLLRTFGLGQRDGRMLLSLPGPAADAQVVFQKLVWPNWADLAEWCGL